MLRKSRLAVLLLTLAASLFLLAFLTATLASPPTVAASPIPDSLTSSSNCEPDELQDNGAWYRFCVPPGWDQLEPRTLMVYAHGYRWYREPVDVPDGHICFGDPVVCINDIVNDLGVAFAASSYPVNGLAVLPALDDLVRMVGVFSDRYGAPDITVIAGVSEGGIITALSVERHPEVFDGGLAACGPIGSWRDQIGYFADGRVLLDYFFPGLIPSDQVTVPVTLEDDWYLNNYWGTTAEPTIFDPANADNLQNLLCAGNLPYLPGITDTMRVAVEDMMGYNIMATNEVMTKVGGNPFDNMNRTYTACGANEADLNANVVRFSKDPESDVEMDRYETSGRLIRPLVTLHTSLDQQVPKWHEGRYIEKTNAAGRWMWLNTFPDNDHDASTPNPLPVDGYGHCNFDVNGEIMPAFLNMLSLVEKQYDLSLDVTVGTDPGVCAATDTIEVSSGTTVYYCYTATNHGNQVRSFHDLTDSVWGDLMTGFQHPLARDESVSTIVAAPITQTTVSEAAWTAYEEGAMNWPTRATDSVTVEITPTDVTLSALGGAPAFNWWLPAVLMLAGGLALWRLTRRADGRA